MAKTFVSTVSPGLAKEYSASSGYATGDYVLYDNKYWRCKETIETPAGTWDETEWEELTDTLKDVKTNIPAITGKSFDLTNETGLTTALATILEAFGGTVIGKGGNVVKNNPLKIIKSNASYDVSVYNDTDGMGLEVSYTPTEDDDE